MWQCFVLSAMFIKDTKTYKVKLSYKEVYGLYSAVVDLCPKWFCQRQIESQTLIYLYDILRD